MTLHSLLLQNPAHLPPGLWRALGAELGEPLDGLPPPLTPGTPLETQEQVVALQAERIAAARDERFALLHAQKHLQQHEGLLSNFKRIQGIYKNADYLLANPSSNTFFPTALPQQQQDHLFATQAAAGGTVHGVRVVSEVRYES